MVIKTLKNVIAAVGAAWIAQMLHLNFATGASVIAMLSLLDTQKQTFSVAWKRFYTAVIGLMICLIAFNVLGYTIVSLGVFLLVFVPVAMRLKAKEGIVVNTVIATHYLSYGVITPGNILNEMLLLGIGIGMGIILNLHMPSLEPELVEAQQEIEAAMKQFFLNMSEKLMQMNRHAGTDFESFKALERRIKKAKKKAGIAQENFIFSKQQDYVAYFQMRLDQFYWMLYMQKHFERIFVTQREAQAMGDFIHKAAHQFTPTNDARVLLGELAVLREDFMKKELPKELLIFENYASLFQLINDLEIFLELKVKYLEDDSLLGI
jgi:uncharacterized membrane protein YgaE (UPF0421/DUF939 family)